MNWRAAIGISCLPTLVGCSLIETANRNLRHEPKAAFEERHLEHRLRHDAKSTLRAIAQQHPKKVFTDEFRDGFEDGFADYLDSGRMPVPPAIPPLKYRSNKYLNPEGHARIYDWFAGFKYGAEVACATGMREYYTVPILVKDQPPPAPLNITVLPTPPDGLSTDPKPAGSPPPPAAKPADVKPADPKSSLPLPLPKVVDAPPPELPKVPEKPKDSPPAAPVPNPVPAPALPPIPKSSQLPAPLPLPLPAETTPVTAVIPAPVPIPVTVTMRPPPAPVVRPQTADLLPPPLTATAGK